MKTLVVTACGVKKNSHPMEAYKLYRSSRIKAVYNRRKGCDMAILSAKYGLVDANEIIEPYNTIMTEERMYELIPLIVEKISRYDRIIYFKGGSNKLYSSCIETACNDLDISIISIGYAHLGDINKISELIS